jgi:hypothetical protein
VLSLLGGVWKLPILLITMGMIWTWSLFSLSHYGLFEWFLYVVYVSYGVQSVVVVRGVLTLYTLYASPSSVIGVFRKLSMSVFLVSNGSDDV